MILLIVLGGALHLAGLTWEEAFYAMALQALLWTWRDVRRPR